MGAGDLNSGGRNRPHAAPEPRPVARRGRIVGATDRAQPTESARCSQINHGTPTARRLSQRPS